MDGVGLVWLVRGYGLWVGGFVSFIDFFKKGFFDFLTLQSPLRIGIVVVPKQNIPARITVIN